MGTHRSEKIDTSRAAMHPRSQRQSQKHSNNTAAPSNGVNPKIRSARPSVKCTSNQTSASTGGSGNVNSPESPVLTLTRGYSEIVDDHEETQEEKHDKAVLALFAKIDVNNDETLSFAELQRGLSDDWGFDDKTISQLLFELDGDGDGEVSIDEWVKSRIFDRLQTYSAEVGEEEDYCTPLALNGK